MSSHDDYAARPRRDPGLTYPDQEDYRQRRPRNDPSPLPGGDAPRHKRDMDPRDFEPSKHSRDNSHERRAGRDDPPPRYRESNTKARRRSPYDDDDHHKHSSRSQRDEDAAAAYGRSKGYREPVPEPDAFAADRDRRDPQSRMSKRPKDYDDYAAEPPRRSKTQRDPDRHARDSPYDDDRRRRQRSVDDGHNSHDRGYKSEGRDRRRDDDRYDDRRRGGGGGGRDRRDDGYASDRGHRRDHDRDRDRDRGSDRRHNDSDRRDRDRDRDRDRRDDDKGKKKSGFNVNDLLEQGQKHYKTVVPLIEKAAKFYMDSKGGK